MKQKLLFALLVTLGVAGCSEKQTEIPGLPNQPDTGRWYSLALLNQGQSLYARNCASCHGTNAEGTADWKTPNANGDYPPPPLNGSAHAWHHPLSVLYQVIQLGGQPTGGTMPAWQGKLDQQQTLAIIASFQDYWSDETYQIWLQRELASRESN